MKQGQDPRKTRNVLKTSNKYQERIILMVFLPSVFICLSFLCIVCVFDPIIAHRFLLNYFPGLLKIFTQFPNIVILIICEVFLISMAISFQLSHDLVGAIDRIKKELDDIIDGRSTRSITCRPNDDMIKELLKRVNVLAAYYVEHKHGKKNS